MLLKKHTLRLFTFGVAIATTVTPNTWAEDASDARWRLELSGGPALEVGGRERNGDWLLSGYVDFEIPTTRHTALSLRAAPLFVYAQNDDHQEFWKRVFGDDYDWDDTVWGGGLGLAYRIYQRGGTYEGFFLEGEALAIGHVGRIEGNGSAVDFLTGLGVGYQFGSHWQTILRFEHVSNAGLADFNSGVNALRVGMGYRF